ncbi:hypothetical protein CEUSTIGMA_g10218.t1 [Chlamydomonas eustigma]|uniref:AB hydrolase-1 domain-containing protein n=1 Tax=Chlamydomonas eustigma TaxID=1157962 RepID=A0A250XIR2_9CHLO|nr:hypothetical protein CEUSTIGMA_g10218.t1 [Chlamydomonas eustigma]|eukprot:GAX82792.1 hypothetical protein CEUSTIGMA_g10218.t1 [Chlamydomonas eustigma]
MSLSKLKISGPLHKAPRSHHFPFIHGLSSNVNTFCDLRCCAAKASRVAVESDEPSTTEEPSHASASSFSNVSPRPAPVDALGNVPGIQIIYRVPQPEVDDESSRAAVDFSNSKPFMLRLPNLDGACSMNVSSMSSLSKSCELFSLHIEREYSGSFQELVEYIKAFLESQLQESPPERPIYLLGEGFGAVVAIAVALDCRHLVHRLLLVNPSTSYLKSPISRVAPLISEIPREFYAAAPFALAPALIANSDPLKLLEDIIFRRNKQQSMNGNANSFNKPGVSSAAGVQQGSYTSEAADALSATLEQLRSISRSLPTPESLRHRLDMLETGVSLVERRLGYVEQRTMILVGGRDRVLPSQEEGSRLAKMMQRAFVKLLPSSGHALLSESNVDIVQLMEEEGFFIGRRQFTSPLGTTAKARRSINMFGTAGPLELPTNQEVYRTGQNWTSTLRHLCSPVFWSTLPDGTIVEGLDGIPDDMRPLLFVGNHQLYAQDMNIMVEEVLLKKGLLMRGLAHPTLFSMPSSQSPNSDDATSSTNSVSSSPNSSGPEEEDQQEALSSGLRNLYRTYGAVEVSGQSFFRLLQQKEAVLLYPGGVREAFKRRHEKYELFWPQRSEFIRMAARFNTTVVPISTIGFEDSIQLVLDSNEILENPFFGPTIKKVSAFTPNARNGVSNDPDNDHSFLPPLIAPQVPARMYFLFGKPVQITKDLYNDREGSQKVYDHIRKQVEDGIGLLLRSREQDPFKEFLPRYFYENPPFGEKRRAPSTKL